MKSQNLRPTRKILRIFAGALFCLFLFSLLSVYRGQVQALSFTWDGGGADNNWSTCANWTTDVCPSSADTVTFNGTSTKDSVVDASFGGTVVSVAINSGYTGTISLSRSLTTSGTFTQSAGIFTAGSQSLSIGSAFTLNTGGNFTASSGITTFSANFQINGGTFTHNGGTVNFAGSTATLSCNNASFNLVTFSNTNGKTIGSNCSLPLGSNPSIPQGIIINGTLTGSGTLTMLAGNFTYNATATLTGFTGFVASGGTVTIAGTANFGSYTTLDLNGVVVLNSGAVVTMPSGTATLASTFTINSGVTFDANGGTMVFDGAVTANITCGGKTFNLVVFAHTAGIKTVGSTCSLPLGANPTLGSGTAAVSLNGTLSGSGTLTTLNNFSLGSTAVLSGFSGLSASSMSLTSASIDFGSYSSFVVSSNYTQTGGTITVPSGADFNGVFTVNTGSIFNAPSGTATFASAFTLNSGSTFNANGGTVTFDGTGGVLSCNNAVFNLVIISSSGTRTVNSTCSLPLGSNPSIQSSVILNGALSGSGTLTFVTGTLVLNAGSAMSGLTGLVGGSLTATNASISFINYTVFTLSSVYTQTGGTIIFPSSGATINNNVTLNAGAVLDASTAAYLNFNRSFLQNSGSTFTAPADTMYVAWNFNLNSGSTFNSNGGTLVFDTDFLNLILVRTCNNTVFNKVVFVNIADTYLDVGADCNFPLGADPTVGAGGNVIVHGTLSGSGILTSTGTFTLSSGYVLSGFSGLNPNNLTIDGTTANLSTFNPLDIDGALLVTNNGTLIAPSSTTTVGGNFTINTGSTFNANDGTVVLDGANQLITGNTTFYNLTKTVTAPASLTFTAGSTQTVLNNLILRGGDAGNLLTLASSTPGTAWMIDPQGSRNVQYVSLSDSNNINAITATAYDSTDGGGNTNWAFAAAPTTPGTPTAASPTNDTTPTFTWIASAGADHYEVQWSQDNSFGSGVTTATTTSPSCSLSTTTCGGTTGLADGTWYVRVRAVAIDGAIISSYSPTGSVVIDTSTPNTLAAPARSGNDPSDNTPEFTGSCVNGDTITLYLDGSAIAPTQVCSGGAYAITPTIAIADGTHTLRATATNPAGTTSAQSPALTFTIDTSTTTQPVQGNQQNVPLAPNTGIGEESIMLSVGLIIAGVSISLMGLRSYLKHRGKVQFKS